MRVSASAKRPAADSASAQWAEVKGLAWLPMRGLSQVGDRPPAVAHVDADQLEALQKRGVVLNVDVEIGDRLHQGRFQVAQFLVIDRKHRGMVVLFEIEERLMPPKVMD